jgi:hypothetical protein
MRTLRRQRTWTDCQSNAVSRESTKGSNTCRLRREGYRFMADSLFTFDQRNLRGTDSNSLWRLYDLANEFFAKCGSQQERTRADKAIRRIVKELQRRHIRL